MLRVILIDKQPINIPVQFVLTFDSVVIFPCPLLLKFRDGGSVDIPIVNSANI